MAILPADRPHRPRRLGGFAVALLGVNFLYRVLPLGGEFSRAFLPDAAGWFALGITGRLWLVSSRAGPFCLCLAGVCTLAWFTAPEKIVTALIWAGLIILQRRGWGQALASRPLLYLGAISYPLYLVNEPIERILALRLGVYPSINAHSFSLIFLPLALLLSLAAAALLLSLAAAALLHHAVERPFMHNSKKLLPPVIAPPLRQ